MEEGLLETKEVSTNVPVFLLKLVSMLNDADNHQFVDWTQSGNSFLVKDQVQFSKIVLPKYFKHNKFASFVRQLNMYGFRKITALTQAGMTPDKDEVEFFHFLFRRGEENLLSQIKRKVTKPDSLARSSEDVTKVLENVKEMRNHQEVITHRISELKHENEELWREVINLRHKHAHQQKVVNKLIHFLVNLVNQTGMGVKRRLPLMIEDGQPSSQPPEKYAKPTIYVEENPPPLQLTQPPRPTVSFPASNAAAKSPKVPNVSGPYITEVASATNASEMSPNHMLRQRHVSQQEKDAEQYVQSTNIAFPEELDDLIQRPHSYDITKISSPNDTSSSSTSKTATVPALGSPYEITPYSPKSDRLSPVDLNNHVDIMQKNIDSIQDLLFDNQLQLPPDYGLFQELFSSSPNNMLPREDEQGLYESPAGNEVVLHPGMDQKNADDEIDAALGDISQFL